MKEFNVKEESNTKELDSKPSDSKPFTRKKGNNRGKRSFNKGRGIRESKVNDPKWYSINETITKQVANIPFAGFVGKAYLVNKNAYTKKGGSTALMTVVDPSSQYAVLPGIAMFKYIPWYGEADVESGSLAIATRALYQYVRKANAGKAMYEAPDLMMYILSMDQVYLAIHEIKRILRLVNTFYLKNKEIPNGILEVMGVDTTDVNGNINSYLARLNILIAKINTMAIPNKFDLFKRRAVLGSVILTDDLENPTQLVVPKADNYYQFTFNDTTHSQSSSLTPVYLQQFITDVNDGFLADKVTVKTYLDKLELMINAIVTDEEMNIMAGDIKKAFESDLYSIPFMEVNEVQEFTYDINLLQQLKNAEVIDIPGATLLSNIDSRSRVLTFKTYDYSTPSAPKEVWTPQPYIVQSNGTLRAKAQVELDKINSTTVSAYNNAITAVSAWRSYIKDTFWITADKQPSNDELMEWTRLLTFVNDDLEVVAGTEIGIGWIILQPHIKGQRVPNPVRWCSQYVSWAQSNTNALDNYKTPARAAVHATYIKTYTFAAFDSTGKRMEKFICSNTVYATAMMHGLSYGPNWESIGEVSTRLGVPGTEWAVNLVSVLGNVKSVTAMADKSTIYSMHELATAALLFNEFIKA